METTLDTIAGAVASHMLDARTVDPTKAPSPPEGSSPNAAGSTPSTTPGSQQTGEEGVEGEDEEERRRRWEAKVRACWGNVG